jgi:hypothetical protein
VRFLTETETLHGPLGKLGTIRALDCWQFRESISQAKKGVTSIAVKSYANEKANSPESLFEKLITAKPMHGEPLEVVPFPTRWKREQDTEYRWASIRLGSLRHNLDALESQELWGMDVAAQGRKAHPAFAFQVNLVEYAAIHLLRHGATFGKNFTSRRYVTDTKLPFEFYGDDSHLDESPLADHHASGVAEYRRRLALGWKPERARGAVAKEVMVPFWFWGYARDFLGPLQEQRCDQPKVQEETAIPATWIRDFCLKMEVKP